MEKDRFKIVETENSEYRYIVEPVGYISITRHISEISDYLKIRNYKGNVVFDNGLITGNTVGRFVEAYFEIKRSLIKPPEEPKKAKREKATEKKEKPAKKAVEKKTVKPEEEKKEPKTA